MGAQNFSQFHSLHPGEDLRFFLPLERKGGATLKDFGTGEKGEGGFGIISSLAAHV